MTHLADVRHDVNEDEVIHVSNLTIINFALKLLGPLREDTLTTRLLQFQVSCSSTRTWRRSPWCIDVMQYVGFHHSLSVGFLRL